MEDHAMELSLADYVAVVRRRWALIVAVTVGAAVLALLWSLTRPSQYRAEAQILLSAQAANQVLDPTASQVRDVARQLENELVFARSRVVLDAVDAELGYPAQLAVAGQSKSADLLTFSATGGDPAAVATAADTYATTFIRMRAERVVAASAETRQAVLDKLVELNGRLAALNAADPATVGQRDALEAQIALYEQYTSGLDLIGELAAASNAQVLSAAQVPESAFSPQPLRSTVLAIALGLMAGVALAFLREFLDDHIRSKDDLQRVTAATTLALVPALAKRRATDASHPLHGAALGEAFRNLRGAVSFVGMRDALRTIQVTSSRPAEGKTTVATHLAVAMARRDSPVVLIDADLRRPSVADRFGLPNQIGLTSVMLGQQSLDAVLQPVPGCPGLHIITSGPSPENAADFLWPAQHHDASPTLPAVLQELVARGYNVIVDSPPVLPVADALTIARAVDGTLFVTAVGISRRREIAQALESLANVEARLIGTVLNHAQHPHAYGYGETTPETWRERLRGALVRARPAPARPVPASVAAALTEPDTAATNPLGRTPATAQAATRRKQTASSLFETDRNGSEREEHDRSNRRVRPPSSPPTLWGTPPAVTLEAGATGHEHAEPTAATEAATPDDLHVDEPAYGGEPVMGNGGSAAHDGDDDAARDVLVSRLRTHLGVDKPNGTRRNGRR